MEEEKNIVIVADGTGRTAKRLMDAVLAQYVRKDLSFSLIQTYTQVRDEAALDKILEELDEDCLVLYSLIARDLATYFHQRLAAKNILHLNVLKPMLDIMSKFLGVHPEYRPGILQVIDDRYYKKVDAIGFTVQHDDGRGNKLQNADIVLLGISRTCKTPISMYLACNFGYKVANIPLVNDAVITANLLRTLSGIPKEKTVGLLMQPEILSQVREERSLHLTRASRSHRELDPYCDIQFVGAEFRFSRDFFAEHGFRTVDVTRRAIEEVSLELIERLGIAV
jgi:regulator of PEP synthase PpsR (kinase-PPPase family)